MCVKTITISNASQAVDIFKKIGVDPYGIDAMVSKTININILVENKPCKVANIIKQEMLSVGGDAAVARGSIDNSIPVTDILIMGNIKQINAFARKIEKQPFGLKVISQNITNIINNIDKNKFVLHTANRKILLGRKTLVMGVLNVTPDSFSDGGLYYSPQNAVDRAMQLIADGVDIIDIGGESTRPGAKSVSIKEELKRVIPVIKNIVRQTKIPLSIDTSKSLIAAEAISSGAEIINDVSAFKNDKKMFKVVKESGAAAVLMHMRGKPHNMQSGNLEYKNLMGEIIFCLQTAVEEAVGKGIDKKHLIIDPGIGFGKCLDDNYRIIKNLAELKIIGLPLMVGTSRKTFIGKITGDDPQHRIEGTAATVAAAILNGCHIVRVHDVAYIKKVASVTDAIARV